MQRFLHNVLPAFTKVTQWCNRKLFFVTVAWQIVGISRMNAENENPCVGCKIKSCMAIGHAQWQALHVHLHCLPQNAANKGLPPLQAALRLKEVHELPIPYASIGSSGLCRLLCPCCSCFAAVTPECQPLQECQAKNGPL